MKGSVEKEHRIVKPTSDEAETVPPGLPTASERKYDTVGYDTVGSGSPWLQDVGARGEPV